MRSSMRRLRSAGCCKSRQSGITKWSLGGYLGLRGVYGGLAGWRGVIGELWPCCGSFLFDLPGLRGHL